MVNVDSEDFLSATVSVLEDIGRLVEVWDVPDPPATLKALTSRLLDARFNVLVIGEAKRGKSSFINSLIGEDVLPTDVDIATSQVFVVRAAADERFQLVFRDGTARSIARTDLPRYGSQVVIDTLDDDSTEAPIRWIECE